MQGYLELSNVNAVEEISALIVAQRAYEMNARVITVGRSNHMTFSDFIWLHEEGGMGPPPPVDMSGEQGIALTRTALRLFLPCVFERSCQGLDAQMAQIRGPNPQ